MQITPSQGHLGSWVLKRKLLIIYVSLCIGYCIEDDSDIHIYITFGIRSQIQKLILEGWSYRVRWLSPDCRHFHLI